MTHFLDNRFAFFYQRRDRENKADSSQAPNGVEIARPLAARRGCYARPAARRGAEPQSRL